MEKTQPAVPEIIETLLRRQKELPSKRPARVMLQLRLPARLYAALESVAARRFQTRTGLAMSILTDALKRELDFMDRQEEELARLPPPPPPFTPEEQARYEKDCAYLESVGQGRPMNRFDFWRLEIEQLTKKRSPGRPRTIR